MRALLLSPLVSQKMGTFVASENSEDLMALRDLIEAGKLTPVIDRTYPPGGAAEAVTHLAVEGRLRFVATPRRATPSRGRGR